MMNSWVGPTKHDDLPLSVGEPAPWFSGAIGSSYDDAVTFDELAGRYIVLFIFGSAARPGLAELLAKFGHGNGPLDGNCALFLGISNDPEDVKQGRLRPRCSGQRFFLDSNDAVSKQYGLAAPAATVTPESIRPVAFILSPTMQIIEVIPWSEPSAFFEQVMSRLNERVANPPRAHNAPVLVAPQVFDRSFCRKLIDLYDLRGDAKSVRSKRMASSLNDLIQSSGSAWITTLRTSSASRKRVLCLNDDSCQWSFVPFNSKRRASSDILLVGCYDAETGGYFRPHRDNTSPVVAHRRFAVTINLNEDYEGGHLRFPEFGRQTYCASPGDAIVFFCSLLHEVVPVTRGRRYAFLSFFYDERSQQLREEYARRMSAHQ